MGVVILTIFVALIVWMIYLQFACRQHQAFITSKDKIEVAHLIDHVFGPKLYKRVGGPGDVNVVAKLKMHAPTLSIDIGTHPGHGTEVDIWMSHWTTKMGMAYHAFWVWRKMRGLKMELAEAEAKLAGSAAAGTAPTTAPAPPSDTAPGFPPAGAGGDSPLTRMPSDPPPPPPPAPPTQTPPSVGRWGKAPGEN